MKRTWQRRFWREEGKKGKVREDWRREVSVIHSWPHPHRKNQTWTRSTRRWGAWPFDQNVDKSELVSYSRQLLTAPRGHREHNGGALERVDHSMWLGDMIIAGQSALANSRHRVWAELGWSSTSTALTTEPGRCFLVYFVWCTIAVEVNCDVFAPAHTRTFNQTHVEVHSKRNLSF